MRRTPFYCRITLLVLLGGAASLALAQQLSNVVYKHVDAQGRVTYANSPIKGGVKVELQPLTVIPSTPGGSLGDARASQATVAAEQKANLRAPSPRPAATEAAMARPTASTQQAAEVAQQRREDVRRRIIDGEIEVETQLYDEVRVQLGVEQKRSSALRAAIGAGDEQRGALARHLERVRDLQDQIAMHEENIASMKQQLRPLQRQARRSDSEPVTR